MSKIAYVKDNNIFVYRFWTTRDTIYRSTTLPNYYCTPQNFLEGSKHVCVSTTPLYNVFPTTRTDAIQQSNI